MGFEEILTRRMPAEWEPHEATWIAWPHEETDWPGKLDTAKWVYVEIIRLLSRSERIDMICLSDAAVTEAKQYLARSSVSTNNVRFHVQVTNRSWLRDSGPTAVYNNGKLEWINWHFNAWAKYDNHGLDAAVPSLFASVTNHPLVPAKLPSGAPVVLEGGSIEVDGRGTILVTEQCLLSSEQERNPGMSREGYESVFREYLGVTNTIWLGEGCHGDDTHGHIDDIARFVRPGTVVVASESDPEDENYKPLQENVRRLKRSKDAQGNLLEVIELPMPSPLNCDDVRLPASYANFYIGNSVVLVPTFNDEKDREVLNLFSKLFSGRRVIGVHAVDLVLGYGTFHCLSQQQPTAISSEK